MTNGLGVRLVHNFSHPTELIVDLTDGPQLARAIIAAGRRSHLHHPAAIRRRAEHAALVVTDWTQPNADEFLTWCRSLLREHGCVAIILDHTGPVEPAEVIAAGRRAGLSYLQHVVAVTATPAHRTGASLHVHTDVIILIRPTVQETH
jgi:hypothetical protein